MCLI
jgi:hypothetical protein